MISLGRFWRGCHRQPRDRGLESPGSGGARAGEQVDHEFRPREVLGIFFLVCIPVTPSGFNQVYCMGCSNKTMDTSIEDPSFSSPTFAAKSCRSWRLLVIYAGLMDL